MTTLGELQTQAWKDAEDAGWHSPRPDENGFIRPTTTFERLALIHSEVSEALEAFRKHGKEAWEGDGGKPEGIGAELADVLIRTCELFEELEIDATTAVLKKMAHNRVRKDVPSKDGGKVI